MHSPSLGYDRDMADSPADPVGPLSPETAALMAELDRALAEGQEVAAECCEVAAFTLRVRDWMTADGEITSAGRKALQRWLDGPAQG